MPTAARETIVAMDTWERQLFDRGEWMTGPLSWPLSSIVDPDGDDLNSYLGFGSR